MIRSEMIELARKAGFAGEDQTELDRLERFGTSIDRVLKARILQIVERADGPERRAVANAIRNLE